MQTKKPTAPGAVQAEERVRVALGRAQEKLLKARRKAQASVDTVRAQIAARQ